MAKKIQIRRGSAADWATHDPILSSGEIGYDVTNKNFKVGDGSTIWSELLYTYVSQTQFNQLLGSNNAMVFKGTLGTGGTIEALPTTYEVGWAYKVITAGTFAGQVCEDGDLIIAIVKRTGSGNQNADWVVVQENLELANYSISIPTSGWTGSVAPFEIAITVNGIVSTDTPTIDINLNGVDYANVAAHLEAWGLIYRAVTGTNTITFYATAVPATAITLQAKVVR
jgi:hypothetical protein